MHTRGYPGEPEKGADTPRPTLLAGSWRQALREGDAEGG